MEDKVQKLTGKITFGLSVALGADGLYLFVMSVIELTRGVMHSPDTSIGMAIWTALVLALGLCKLISWITKKGWVRLWLKEQ